MTKTKKMVPTFGFLTRVLMTNLHVVSAITPKRQKMKFGQNQDSLNLNLFMVKERECAHTNHFNFDYSNLNVFISMLHALDGHP